MILIKNARIINHDRSHDGLKDILINGSLIEKIGESIQTTAETIDAQGKLVFPGLIDVHVHFRDPGKPKLETIQGGAKIAAMSGFTTVCVMPNTTPAIDSPELVQWVIDESAKTGINVLPSACVTKGRAGEELADIEALKNAGAVAFTDDGAPIMNTRIMREALDICAKLGVPIFGHEEDKFLASGGAMNEGSVSRALGIKGIPREAEETIIARDVLLARLTGGHVHVQHLSSGRSVDIIRKAKAEGIKVTAETAPHYFTLTDEAVRVHGTNAAMSPSLRTEKDRRDIIEGLRDGTIDMIATDHAPHSAEDKAKGFGKAPNGIIGLETAFPLAITKLVKEEGFSYYDIARLMSFSPAQLLGIDRGCIAEGKTADITIIDPNYEFLLRCEDLHSKYKNCPFIGMKIYGRILHTLCNGKLIYGQS
jgi:dihydroorotase